MEIHHENTVWRVYLYFQKVFFNSLVKTIEGWKLMELSDRMKQCQKIPEIDRLSIAVKNAYATVVGIT